MRIALDAMGGDHAPEPIVAGAVQAVAADPEMLGRARRRPGPRRAARPRRRRRPRPHRVLPLLPGRRHGRKPRGGPAQEARQLHQPLLAAAGPEKGGRHRQRRQHRRHGGRRPVPARFLKNVSRPGIAAVMPTIKGPSVMIDVGANVSPKAEQLFQYGVMGSIFAKHILQRERPTIGLMNVGSEEAKGTDLAKETHALFNASPLKDRFVGNVEGRDIQRGAADVVVCDGFVGNVVLKTCEGVFEFLIKVLHKELLGGLRRRARQGGAGAARAGQPLRVQRLRRRAVAGHRRHLHHLPRQFRRPGHQERPRRRRPVRPRRAERADRQGAGSGPRRGRSACVNSSGRATGTTHMSRSAFLFPGQGAQAVGMGRDWPAGSPPSAACTKRRRPCSATTSPTFAGTDPRNASTQPSSASRPCSSPAWPPWRRCARPARGRRPLRRRGRPEPGGVHRPGVRGGAEFRRRPARGQGARRGHAGGRRRHARRHGQRPRRGPAGRRGAVRRRRAGRPDPGRQSPLSRQHRGFGGRWPPARRWRSRWRRRAAGPSGLAVAGAFHTPFMKPADEALAAALEGVTIRRRACRCGPTWTPGRTPTPRRFASLLVRQVLHPVLWEQTVRGLLADGCDRFYEIGPGRVLAGLLKRVHRKAECVNVSA